MRRHRHREPAPPLRFQYRHRLACTVLGGTVAIAVLSASALVFAPFSDLSVLQLAAGPHAQASGGALAPVVLARTGRAWGADGRHCQAAASSAPVTRVARRDTRGP